MKPAGNRNEFASNEQELPVQMAATTEGIVPGDRLRDFVSLQSISGKQADLPTDNAAAPGANVNLNSAPDTVSELLSSRAPTHERLLRQIEAHVQLIGSAKFDRLSFVLKPDAQTEVFLQFRMRAGNIEARARCERGNFDLLNAEWGQLQQSLLTCGVRLASLTESAGAACEPANMHSDRSDTSGSSHHHKQPPEARDLLGSEREASGSELAQRGRLRSFNRVSTRLLESWA